MRHGDKVDPQGGAKLLRLLQKSSQLKKPTHIVGFTAFDDLRTEFAPLFGEYLWFIIHYDASSDLWKHRLETKLIHVVESKEGRPDRGFGVDIAIITALERPELAAVLDLDACWKTLDDPRDDTIYHSGTFSCGDRKLRVVASAVVDMGMPAAAAHTMKVIEAFRPRYVAMLGIAAGVKGTPGDVLIADQSWDYAMGKVENVAGEVVLSPAPQPILLDYSLKTRFSYFGLSPETLARISGRWKGTINIGSIALRIGPLASGPSVVAHRGVVDGLLVNNRKLVGLEMETYAVFVAERFARKPRPKVMAIKSICDFADDQKSDEYQNLAAFTSAQYFYEFALAMLIGDADTD
ncbi:MAG: hypothetical protein JNM86_09965 [Phycisphaerae bacterium]|nr:hypothetical protein [Phycisphaerae bacterium]